MFCKVKPGNMIVAQILPIPTLSAVNVGMPEEVLTLCFVIEIAPDMACIIAEFNNFVFFHLI